MSIERVDVGILDLMRTMKSLSLRELARKTNNSHGNLSTWFQGKMSSLSNERAEEIQRVLGIDPLTGRLFAGIHRWKTPSTTVWDIEKAEYAVRTLFSGGGTVVVVARDGIIAPHLIFNQALVFVPIVFPDVRIVLKYGLSVQRINPIAPERCVKLGGLGSGWKWQGGSVADECPMDAIQKISSKSFDRIDADESLTVSDLDAILGISGSPDWTWERLTAVLQGKGITPEEAARKMGIL